MSDDGIDHRLAALEARIEVPDAPPVLEGSRSGLRTLPLGAGIGAAAILVGSVAVTGAIMGLEVRSHPGVQNPGQPLHGAELECMTPREAERYLRRHDFEDVIWQVETGTVGVKGSGRSRQLSSPPEHGYVVPGSIIDGRLHMIIDQREGVTGTGICFDMRMP